MASWRLHLEAANLSPRTARGYMDDGALSAAFLADKGMPSAVAAIKREHVEAFIAAELERTSASSAATRYRSLQQFFRWLDGRGRFPRPLPIAQHSVRSPAQSFRGRQE